jgi:TolB-like protein/DNA-binding winged helix-turn-helix (wHTH) protein/Tfp pilus assembly protein PilF
LGVTKEAISRERVRFAGFEFNFASGELQRDGIPLKLQPQPARILAILIQRAGEIVARQELTEQVWGSETFVDFEQGLNFAIRQIRTVLQDDADQPRFLETLPRRGYRFIAAVEDVSSPSSAPPELQAKSDSRTIEPGSPSRPRRSIWPWLAAALFLATFSPFAIYRYRLTTRQPASAGAPAVRSIAVLPLANLSGDPNQEYFSDGLTDELITELAKAGSLRVISRTSVISFKGSRKRAPEIGRDLHVDALVEGTVERVGEHIRIRAQLIRADSDQHLWAESYDSDLRDVLKLEREVAADIAKQIGYRISANESSSRLGDASRPPQPDTVSPAAHENYLKGRYYWNKRTDAGLQKGIEYFQKALATDPRYAPAYAGLADSYIMLANWGFTHPGPAYLQAKSSAMKALELDNQSAEAQTSLAYATLLYDWDWAGAEAGFRRAITLNPNYASAHHFYSILLMTAGRQAEAIAEIKRARELDPLSLIINDVEGWLYYEGRQYDQAIQQYKNTLEIDPNYVPVLLDLGNTYLRLEDFKSAIAQFEKARAIAGHNAAVLLDLAKAQALSGVRNEAVRSLNRIHPSPDLFVSSWDLSLVHAALDDRVKVMALLKQAADEHDGWVIRLAVEPEFDRFHSNPEFLALVQRIKIPRLARQ